MGCGLQTNFANFAMRHGIAGGNARYHLVLRKAVLGEEDRQHSPPQRSGFRAGLICNPGPMLKKALYGNQVALDGDACSTISLFVGLQAGRSFR